MSLEACLRSLELPSSFCSAADILQDALTEEKAFLDFIIRSPAIHSYDLSIDLLKPVCFKDTGVQQPYHGQRLSCWPAILWFQAGRTHFMLKVQGHA